MYLETMKAKDISKYYIEDNSIIVDLRSTNEYNQAHIPNAINIPFEDLEESIDQIIDYDTIILYCDRGNLSLVAERDLKKVLQSRIVSIVGGYIAYKQYYS